MFCVGLLVVCRADYRNGYTFQVGNKVSSMKWLEQCSIIEGNLEIKWLYSNISPQNFSGVSFPKLEEITGYLMLFRVDGLSTIGQLFPNLRVIRAQEEFFDFGIVLYENKDLMSISLHKLGYVGGNSNLVAMFNPQLCYVDDYVKWDLITSIRQPPTTSKNRRKRNGCDLVDGCPANCKDSCWDMDSCQKGNIFFVSFFYV